MHCKSFLLFHLDVLLLYFYPRVASDFKSSCIAVQGRWAQQSTFGMVSTGHAQSLVVGRSWKHGHWFILSLLSLSLMTAEHCRSSPISACLAFVLQRTDEVAASDICFVLKEGRVSISLSELSLVIGFQKAYLNSILKPNLYLFSVLSFSSKKRRSSIGFARDIF